MSSRAIEFLTARQTFTFTFHDGAVIHWNIDKVLEFCAKTQMPIEQVPVEVLQMIFEKWDIDSKEALKADPSFPGVVAPILDNGDVHYILIDGAKRAFKTFVDGGKFFAFRLPDNISRACVIEGALDRIP